MVTYVRAVLVQCRDVDSKLLQTKDGLPDPKGSLSTCLSSQAIALANKEVEKVTSEKGFGKQRGHTDRERYGAPSHTPVLLQQLPPVCGSLECSKLASLLPRVKKGIKIFS